MDKEYIDLTIKKKTPVEHPLKKIRKLERERQAAVPQPKIKMPFRKLNKKCQKNSQSFQQREKEDLEAKLRPEVRVVFESLKSVLFHSYY